MQANDIQIEQANSQAFLAELYSAAQEILFDTDGEHEQALQVVELIEDGKYLEAVMIGMNF